MRPQVSRTLEALDAIAAHKWHLPLPEDLRAVYGRRARQWSSSFAWPGEEPLPRTWQPWLIPPAFVQPLFLQDGLTLPRFHTIPKPLANHLGARVFGDWTPSRRGAITYTLDSPLTDEETEALKDRIERVAGIATRIPVEKRIVPWTPYVPKKPRTFHTQRERDEWIADQFERHPRRHHLMMRATEEGFLWSDGHSAILSRGPDQPKIDMGSVAEPPSALGDMVAKAFSALDQTRAKLAGSNYPTVSSDDIVAAAKPPRLITLQGLIQTLTNATRDHYYVVFPDAGGKGFVTRGEPMIGLEIAAVLAGTGRPWLITTYRHMGRPLVAWSPVDDEKGKLLVITTLITEKGRIERPTKFFSGETAREMLGFGVGIRAEAPAPAPRKPRRRTEGLRITAQVLERWGLSQEEAKAVMALADRDETIRRAVDRAMSKGACARAFRGELFPSQGPAERVRQVVRRWFRQVKRAFRRNPVLEIGEAWSPEQLLRWRQHSDAPVPAGPAPPDAWPAFERAAAAGIIEPIGGRLWSIATTRQNPALEVGRHAVRNGTVELVLIPRRIAGADGRVRWITWDEARRRGMARIAVVLGRWGPHLIVSDGPHRPVIVLHERLASDPRRVPVGTLDCVGGLFVLRRTQEAR